MSLSLQLMQECSIPSENALAIPWQLPLPGHILHSFGFGTYKPKLTLEVNLRCWLGISNSHLLPSSQGGQSQGTAFLSSQELLSSSPHPNCPFHKKV